MRKLVVFVLLMSAIAFGQNPATAVFPGAVATDSTIFVATPNSTSRLTLAINAVELAIHVADGTKFRGGNIITIGTERMLVCSVLANVLTLCTGSRGFDNTVAAAHSAGLVVDGLFSSRHHNQVAAEIKAMQKVIVGPVAYNVKGYGAKGDGTTDDTAAIQAAVCALPTAGGTVVIPYGEFKITGNITSCSKDKVVIEKLAGAIITAAFTVLNHTTYSRGPETFTAAGVGPYSSSPFFMGPSDAPINFGALDTGFAIGRSLTGNYPQGYLASAASINHDYAGTTGTASGLIVQLNLSDVTTSNGSTGIYSVVTKGHNSTDISIGSHGQCDMRGAGLCVGVNAEGSQLDAGHGGQIFGVVSQMNSVRLGTPTVYGMNTAMHHGGTNPGYGHWIHAAYGDHAAGMLIEEDVTGGKFGTLLTLKSRNSAVNTLRMANDYPSTAVGYPSAITFGKGIEPGVNDLAQITSDISYGGTFQHGYLAFLTSDTSTMYERMRISNEGYVGINTIDLDGTPARGQLTVKGKTNDGSGNIFVGRDSDEVNVASIDTNGGMTLLGTISAAPGGTVPAQVAAPANDHTACVAKSIADDANYHYYCVTTDTWVRVAWTAGAW